MAQQECSNDPARIAAWMPLLRSLGPGLLAICDTAQQRTVDFVARELEEHMLLKNLSGPAKQPTGSQTTASSNRTAAT